MTAAKKKTTALKAKGKQELAPDDLFSTMLSDAGKGIENADKDSFAVPFIICLQGLSPQLETVEGARPGLFINSVTNELFKTVNVIPVYFERQFLRWVDRAAGGGFKGSYSPLEVEEMLADGEAERSPDGLDIRASEIESLKDTRQHYVLMQDAIGGWTPAVLACGSTQIKKSKNWITQINNFKIEHGDQVITPPSWARAYTVSSQKESNNKGEWHGIAIRPNEELNTNPGGVISAEVYMLGKKFYKQIVAGKVRVQHEDLDSAAAEDNGEAF